MVEAAALFGGVVAWGLVGGSIFIGRITIDDGPFGNWAFAIIALHHS